MCINPTTNTGWTRKKKEKENRACLMMLANWLPFLIVISFDAGFATHPPPRWLGLLGCLVQMGIGLLGDSVWANWALGWQILSLSQHAQKERDKRFVFLSDCSLKHCHKWLVNSRGVSTVFSGVFEGDTAAVTVQFIPIFHSLVKPVTVRSFCWMIYCPTNNWQMILLSF